MVIKTITTNAKKFIYMVAYAGITGSGQKEDLSKIIENVRKYSNTPLYIGFGVDENTCKEKIIGVDGVIVGSAFVKYIIDDSLSNDEKIKRISSIAKDIKEKITEEYLNLEKNEGTRKLLFLNELKTIRPNCKDDLKMRAGSQDGGADTKIQ